jgi:hypothetical protein
MDPDSLGEDRRREPRSEREQRGVPAFAAAIDPVSLQALPQRVGGDVLPSVPTRASVEAMSGPAPAAS